jgi:hypothetical protein
MSNSTFKSVKNLTGVLSDLNVSGDAQIHDTLSASGISADIVVQLPPGKTLRSVKLTGPSGTYAASTALTKLDGSAYTTPSIIKVVGAVLSSNGTTVTGTSNLGDEDDPDSLFLGASSADVKVGVYASSIATAALGDTGAAVTSVTIPLGKSIKLVSALNVTTLFVPSVTLYYYV